MQDATDMLNVKRRLSHHNDCDGSSSEDSNDGSRNDSEDSGGRVGVA